MTAYLEEYKAVTDVFVEMRLSTLSNKRYQTLTISGNSWLLDPFCPQLKIVNHDSFVPNKNSFLGWYNYYLASIIDASFSPNWLLPVQWMLAPFPTDWIAAKSSG
jgi:hypothetical protein